MPARPAAGPWRLGRWYWQRTPAAMHVQRAFVAACHHLCACAVGMQRWLQPLASSILRPITHELEAARMSAVHGHVHAEQGDPPILSSPTGKKQRLQMLARAQSSISGSAARRSHTL